jgi:hypothetical protein
VKFIKQNINEDDWQCILEAADSVRWKEFKKSGCQSRTQHDEVVEPVVAAPPRPKIKNIINRRG